MSQKAATPGAEELNVQYIYDLHDTVMLDICFSTPVAIDEQVSRQFSPRRQTSMELGYV